MKCGFMMLEGAGESLIGTVRNPSRCFARQRDE